MPEKLLIVDDELDVCEFTANFFRKRKIDVLTAVNGEEALKTVISQQPKVVLLDIKMEGMDGIDTLSKIKEMNKHTKVIMITGRNDEEAVQKTKELGAADFIHKPLQLDELERVVLKIFNK